MLYISFYKVIASVFTTFLHHVFFSSMQSGFSIALSLVLKVIEFGVQSDRDWTPNSMLFKSMSWLIG